MLISARRGVSATLARVSQSSIDPAALAVIACTPKIVRSLVMDLPLELRKRPNDEGWSLEDIVAHLHDVEGGAMVERIQRMLSEERPFIASIDPPARLAAGGYASRETSDLLDELDQQRAEHVAWLRQLTPEQLARQGQHQEVGEIRVIDLAHQWAAHDMDHLRQMSLMIQQHLAPLMGNTRAFYDV